MNLSALFIASFFGGLLQSPTAFASASEADDIESHGDSEGPSPTVTMAEIARAAQVLADAGIDLATSAKASSVGWSPWSPSGGSDQHLVEIDAVATIDGLDPDALTG